MVKQHLIKVYCIAFLVGASLRCSTVLAQQSTQEMQRQMALADALQSTADTNLYKTPLKTFQKYFDNSKSPNLKELYKCMTDRLRLETLEGQTPTDEELAMRSLQAQQSQFSNITLDSFFYSPDPKHPQITIVTSGVENRTKVIEQVTLVLSDTQTGWKIDKETILNKGRAAATITQ